MQAGRFWLTGKTQGDPALLAQLEGLNAPQAVIDKYNAKFDFELWESSLPAWEIVLLTSPADYNYREVQKGKKIYNKFHGFKSTALTAILSVIKPKNAGRVFRQIRLIEYGALRHGETI